MTILLNFQTWNDLIAVEAQKLAENCDSLHQFPGTISGGGTGYTTLGEAVAVFPTKTLRTYTDVVFSFFDEGVSYDYAAGTCSDGATQCMSYKTVTSFKFVPELVPRRHSSCHCSRHFTIISLKLVAEEQCAMLWMDTLMVPHQLLFISVSMVQSEFRRPPPSKLLCMTANEKLSKCEFWQEVRLQNFGLECTLK